MWGRIFNLFCLFLLVSETGVLASADQEGASFNDVESRGTLAKTVELGVNVYHFDYAERLPAPVKSTEQGTMPGFSFEYWARPMSDQGSGGDSVRWDSWFWNVGFEFTHFDTHYDGTTQPDEGAVPVQNQTTNNFILARTRFGMELVTLPWAEGTHLKAYSGLGARFWNRGQDSDNDSATIAVKVPEEYAWVYLPVGLRLETQLSQRWSLALDAAANVMLWGRIQVDYEQVTPWKNVQAGLGRTVGWRIEAPIAWRIGEATSLVLEPWFEASSIGASDTWTLVNRQNGNGGVSAYEPDSRTYQYGGQMRLAFQL